MSHKCDVCKLEYVEEETAKACQDWCSTRNSCNFLIAKQAINKNMMSKESADTDKRYKK